MSLKLAGASELPKSLFQGTEADLVLGSIRAELRAMAQPGQVIVPLWDGLTGNA